MAPQSAGTVVLADGGVARLVNDDFEMTPLREWQSAVSGARYPVEWRVTVPRHDIDLSVRAAVDDQEQVGVVRYWEGAVESYSDASEAVTGRGYLELTGY